MSWRSGLLDCHGFAERLDRDALHIFDASWFLGDDGVGQRQGYASYQQCHIRRSTFF